MEYMFRTHKEPAWGWIGALIEGRRRAATSRATPTVRSTLASMLGRRAAC